MNTGDQPGQLDHDALLLNRMGYRQELARRMSAFSNYAISLSIICILSGGINSFHVGFNSVGGASIGIGWPLACLFSLCVALSMAQIASAYPTAGGLYHWASILGGRGWGWITAWFNLLGLVFVLASVNVGTYFFTAGALDMLFGIAPKNAALVQFLAVAAITFSQALFNHFGIRTTTRLTDLSGYLILIFAVGLTIAMIVHAQSLDISRIFQFTNYSGIPAEAPVWPKSPNMLWVFALGLLLPFYTITGFDASAHTAEETVNASKNVAKGLVQSVWVSGVFGWVMLIGIILGLSSMDGAAEQGANVIFWAIGSLDRTVAIILCSGIAFCQYLCGLACLTSASRMAFAFARDGGLPASNWLRKVSVHHQTPSIAIWSMSAVALAFTIYTPAYQTIAAACAMLVYISYGIPIALGLFAYRKTWTHFGEWNIGNWFRPLAFITLAGTLLILVVSVQPPNEKNLHILIAAIIILFLVWFLGVRKSFAGPPRPQL